QARGAADRADLHRRIPSRGLRGRREEAHSGSDRAQGRGQGDRGVRAGARERRGAGDRSDGGPAGEPGQAESAAGAQGCRHRGLRPQAAQACGFHPQRTRTGTAQRPQIGSRMAEYSLREVVQLAGLSRHIVRRLAQEGVVAPARGRNREYRFSFQDLIVLRTARGLYAANIAPRRVLRALKRLRSLLPESVPMCGLRVSALGSDVVVHESAYLWEADSGQLLLDFDLRTDSGAPLLIERHRAQPSDATTHFESACRLEDDEPERACLHYRQAIASDPAHLRAYLNL